ncbi:hypothetical protein Tco_0477974 [Tanacetum coccineum]
MIPFLVTPRVSALAGSDSGLGVNCIYALNHALLFKWIWRFRNYTNAVWVQVVKAVHGEDGKRSRLALFLFPRLFALETNKLISVTERKRRGISLASFRCHPRGGAWKRISDKRTKNEAKNDKTEHGMEKREKPKSKSKSSQPVKKSKLKSKRS